MILDRIVADSRLQLEIHKRSCPLAELQRVALKQSDPLDFASALLGDGIKLIAEIKKASPSKGVIRHDFDPIGIAQCYAENGASAISVLTESKYFQGSLDHLRDIKITLADRKLPLLRKDFLYDPYQIYQSRAYGADGLLLIVSILTMEKLRELLELSHDLNMHCLVEVHNEDEVRIAVESGARTIGINNRDLNTFAVDLSTTEKLRPLVPSDRIVVSESGIKTRKDVEKLEELGVDAVLIGESFMAAPDIAMKMKELI